MRIFRSIRFNIFLGALIALASALGTFLPQITEAPEKVAIFQQSHPQWSRLFEFLQLFNIYQSWWFMGLLGLMAFDVVACKLWNRPPDIGMVALPPEATNEKEAEKHLAQKEAALKLKPYQATLLSGLPFELAFQGTQTAMREEGYHLQEDFTTEAGGAFVATRHRLQRWGSYLAHIALVVILSGALLKAVYGFVEMVPVLEGGSRPMQYKPDWELYVDKFTVKYYDGTFTPKSFSSVMRVQQGRKVLGAKTIYVNDPLDINGIRFYQASWGAGGMFRSATLMLGRQVVVLPQRKPIKIAGTPFSVEADMLLPNFTVNNGQAQTASLDLSNPAVRFIFHMGPHKTAPLWLFENNPGLCFSENENGVLSRAPAPPFFLKNIDPVLFSGIQVAYDPGYKVVVAGSLMWLMGMITLFYLHRRRLWVLIEPAGAAAARVSVGGWSSRGRREFENEFEQLMGRLHDRLASTDFKLSSNPLVEVS